MKKIFLLVFILFISSIGFAQYNYITLYSPTNLSFPSSLLPGISSSVATTASTAGKFRVYITQTMTVGITFTLPTYLTKTGGFNLPITFIATKSNSSVDGTLGTSFNPYTGTTVRRTGTSTNSWYIRLGATIPTPSTQVAGTYNGTIVLIATFITY